MSREAAAYWIVRRSLSSGGHSADPVADDDSETKKAGIAPGLSFFRFVMPREGGASSKRNRQR